ncbi:MAG: hypothetical protein GQ573_02565 [Gammaproteobacteria bacterium]|nr:hypothetical protein [Gammaproteobacteria bacterium]
MNTIESTSTNSIASVYTEQPVSAPEVDEQDLTTNFYLVGGVINITMITAYFIWAYKAWKRVDKLKGR